MELARQQEEIRRQLMELRNELGDKGKIDNILKDMEENEIDIINDKISQESILRQKEILTRLLETKESKREQGEDNSRESNEWLNESDNITTKYLEYIKQKKAQEELLKTTPIELKPYYKKKVNAYFNNLIKNE
jgi:hypothetical protein